MIIIQSVDCHAPMLTLQRSAVETTSVHGSKPGITYYSNTTLKLHFHLYKYMYVCIFLSYQDRLVSMKCFNSCVCMCIIRFDHCQERFRRMTHTSPCLGHSLALLIRYIHKAVALRTATEKWKHSLSVITLGNSPPLKGPCL